MLIPGAMFPISSNHRCTTASSRWVLAGKGTIEMIEVLSNTLKGGCPHYGRQTNILGSVDFAAAKMSDVDCTH